MFSLLIAKDEFFFSLVACDNRNGRCVFCKGVLKGERTFFLSL